MHNDLLSGFNETEEEKEKRRQTILSNIAGVAAVYDYLQRQLNILENHELTEATFNNPNWAYNQARILGEKRVLTKALKTLQFSKGIKQ